MRLVLNCLYTIVFIFSTNYALAETDEILENGLTNALKFDTKSSSRLGSSGEAIQAYMREGIVNKKPNLRYDYTDYYIVNKPSKIMGHELVMIEEEYMSQYVGCCVSPGLGITVKVAGDTKKLEIFAKENKCSFTDRIDFQQEINNIGIKTKVLPGDYASLSCRERDAE